MKSISPVIATVILLLMTVAAGGLAYLTITGFQSQAESGGKGAVEQVVAQTQSQLKIESVSGGKIYVRNTGTQPISKIVTYLDGVPRNITCPEPMEPGRVYVCELNETIPSCPTGYTQIQLGSGSTSSTIRVRCEQLQFGGGGGGPVCGNTNCETGETCSNCPADCGSCSYTLKLENSTEWYTFGMNDVDSVYPIDIDGDGKIEIITGGWVYDGGSGFRQLGIWNYTSGNLLLENSTEWPVSGDTYALTFAYPIDIDGDSVIEIITAGTRGSAQLRVWNYTNSKLLIENSTEWPSVDASSVYPIDIDGDGAIEILTAGDKFTVWNYTNGNLLLENSTNAWAYSIYPIDIDGDGAIEILTGGTVQESEYAYNGQLRVWNYTNGNLLVENSTEWYTGPYTEAKSVYPVDIDGDGATEILTAGYVSDGSTYDYGQLRVWNYTNGNLLLENSTEWYLSGWVVAYSVYPIDIDGDGAIEILTGGYAWPNGQLRVWNYTNGNLLLENSTEWSTLSWWYTLSDYTEAYSVYPIDIDGDGAIEILTGGYSQFGEMLVAQLRVWNYTVYIPPPLAYCGDGNCDSGETCSNCTSDCGSCQYLTTFSDGSNQKNLTFTSALSNNSLSLNIPNAIVTAATMDMSGWQGLTQFKFSAKVDYTTGSGPHGISSADFDKDGNPDVVVVNYNSNTFSFLRNNGDGTFQAKVDYATGTYPIGISSADFDKDGDPDVVVTNENAGTFSFFRNYGNGTFAAKVDYTTGTRLAGISSADFDKDGDPDVVVANVWSETFSFFRNNGDGTFASKVDYTTGSGPFDISSADFDKDGYPDVIVTNQDSNTFSFLRNYGNGTFAAKVDYATGSLPWGISSADFDKDGDPDVVVANYGSDTFSFFRNNGNGTFAAKVDYAAGTYPHGISSADFDKDGDPDVVVVNYNSGTFSFFRNNGDGTFAAKVDYAAGYAPVGISSADFDKDGDPDVVVSNLGSNTLSVFKGNGAELQTFSGFAARIDYTAGTWPYGISSADFDNDGDQDVVVASNYAGTFSFFRNNGAGTFAAKVDYTAGTWPYGISSADFDNDGDPDVVVANGGSNTFSFLRNYGNGTFATKVDYSTGAGPWGISSADFDNDGDQDVVTTDYSVGTISFFRNYGNGTFAARVNYATGTYPSGISSADFDNDGDPDVVTANQGANTFSFFRNYGNGTFQARVDYTAGTGPKGISSADFDKDGDPDVVVTNWNSNTISFFRNYGNGTFQARVDYTTGSEPRHIYSADFDNDGDPDIVVANSGSNTFSFFRNNGDGTFQARVDYATGVYSEGISSADFDNDGDQDVVTSNYGANTFSFIRNTGTQSQDYPHSPTLDIGLEGTDWTGPLILNQTNPQTFSGSSFVDELNSLIPVCSCTGCTITGSNCTINLEFTSTTAGILQAYSLNITYTG